jgi:hypothetical protein
MGASIIAYWPGITEAQIDSQPGFFNDDKAWGDWMAACEEEAAVHDAVRRLGADAILTFKTDGWDDEDVNWVTPLQLREAAERLREAIKAGSPDAGAILACYATGANGIEPVSEEFVRDLDDIIALTKWSEEQGATRMTLEVNW